MITKDANITDDELFFAIFCIESIAERLNKKGSDVYKLLTDKSKILDKYIIPHYDVLHTQGKDYIVDEIVDYMREEGVIE